LTFSSTKALTSQWESSVFVFPIKAPALMILDEYGAEDRNRFSSPVVLGTVLSHRLPWFEFQSLAVRTIHSPAILMYRNIKRPSLTTNWSTVA
jgi:hypothetical protein